MKYVCFGYFEEKKFDALPKAQQDAMVEECFSFDDSLKRNGHWVRGEALQSVNNAVTLRWQNGKAAVTDGPYAETKEQIGGILVLEARDLNHAIQIMSKHPAIRTMGPFEIRPLDEDFTNMVNTRRPQPTTKET